MDFIEKVYGSTYVLFIFFDKSCSIIVGKLGSTYLKKGHYLYIGSAKKSIRPRLLRHLKRIKNKFWHIDYILSDPCPSVITNIMINQEPCECIISGELSKSENCELVKKGFGSSDCHCISHFFRIKEDKVNNLMSLLFKKGFSSIIDH